MFSLSNNIGKATTAAISITAKQAATDTHLSQGVCLVFFLLSAAADKNALRIIAIIFCFRNYNPFLLT